MKVENVTQYDKELKQSLLEISTCAVTAFSQSPLSKRNALKEIVYNASKVLGLDKNK